MFGENLAALRKQKGMSQEVLAQQLNVVRQTISKWEKGLSVPDAEMLTKIADLFEVNVDVLLGSKINRQDDIDQIAAQLAILNEQLALKNRNNRKLLRNIAIGFLLIMAMTVVLNLLFSAQLIKKYRTINLSCVVDGINQNYVIEIDKDDKVVSISGNGEVLSTIDYKEATVTETINNLLNYYHNNCDSLDYSCDNYSPEYYKDYHLHHYESETDIHHSDELSEHSHH